MKPRRAKTKTKRTSPNHGVEPGRVGILAAAAQLFSAKGFEATSINDLASKVGLSKATIYHYFQDKNQIYVDVILHTLGSLCEEVEQAVAKKSGATAKLFAYAEAHARFFEINLDSYIATAVGFGGIRQPPERRRAVSLRDRYERNLREIIEAGIESGELRAIDARLAAKALLSCLNWMARWYRRDGPKSAVEIARVYTDLFVVGLQARPK